MVISTCNVHDEIATNLERRIHWMKSDTTKNKWHQIFFFKSRNCIKLIIKSVFEMVDMLFKNHFLKYYKCKGKVEISHSSLEKFPHESRDKFRWLAKCRKRALERDCLKGFLPKASASWIESGCGIDRTVTTTLISCPCLTFKRDGMLWRGNLHTSRGK